MRLLLPHFLFACGIFKFGNAKIVFAELYYVMLYVCVKRAKFSSGSRNECCAGDGIADANINGIWIVCVREYVHCTFVGSTSTTFRESRNENDLSCVFLCTVKSVLFIRFTFLNNRFSILVCFVPTYAERGTQRRTCAV